MSSRSAVLLFVLLLALGLAGAFLLRTRREPAAPALEAPGAPRAAAPVRPQVELESSAERHSAVEVAPAPPSPPQAAEDLRAEGARRGWQLPLGKGWWLDTLINPKGIDLEGQQLEVLQEAVLSWGDRVLALKLQRKQRLDVYAHERVAAGLALQDPAPDAVLPEGKEHVTVVTHTLQAPNQVWRVDIGPGDDAELDSLDRQIANVWCDAVVDLRKRVTALQR